MILNLENQAKAAVFARNRRRAGDRHCAATEIQTPTLPSQPIWGFHSHGGTQNGWFTNENLIKIDNLWVPRFMTIYGNLHLKV